MHRFYSANTNLQQKTIALTDKQEIHHLKNVLRFKKNNPITIFNGKGQEAAGQIISITAEKVEIKITSTKQAAPENKISITLACALPKKAKFEYIIEKTTELGVDEIIPLATKRTEVVLKGDRAEKKNARYQTVAINAAKQCKRTTIPTIRAITKLKDIITEIPDYDLALIPWLEGERASIAETFKLNKTVKKIIFFIGPEGDFTPEEAKLCIAAGAAPVSLGPTVLKVDTAAISVIAFANLLINQ